MTQQADPLEWYANPPAAFDIAACYYPRPPDKHPGPDLRPGLIVGVLQGNATGRYACRVCYGTTNLKLLRRLDKDVIVQNASHIDQFGLKKATRFDLDTVLILPWNNRFFGFWAGYSTPVIGSLTEVYVRDFAFKMMRRTAPKPKNGD